MVINADWTYTEFMETIGKIRERSKTDREFREKCKRDSQRAISEITGHRFDYYDIFFVETVDDAKLYVDSAHTFAFVLPDVEEK
ncbi:hypothetical protein JD969_09645 [Planctomycetota bacterium]|nr:hypothetical protein JD969_09645 [Planctomycetota bacterium]